MIPWDGGVHALMTPLYHEIHGTGRPILALHGFAASTYEWRDYVAALSATHQLILVDLKGHGRSPKPRDRRYAVREQASLVLAFIREHGLQNVTVIGHSLGGFVALLAVLQAPELFERLILIDTLAYRQPIPFVARVLTTPLLGPFIQRLIPTRLQIRLGFKRAYYHDHKISADQIRVYAAAYAAPGGRHALRETVRTIVPPDLDELEAKYATIAVPTLIVWARPDALVPLANGQRLHAAIQRSTLIVLEETGHDCPEETPQLVLGAIRAFLGSSP
jgi:pimeloyl-ACP methyl ester carboxylesterase